VSENTASRASEPAPRPRATRAFFLLALGITFGLQLPAVLAHRGVIAMRVEHLMLPAALGAFGPLLAAVLVSRFESGAAGTRALFAPLRTWRVGAGWYLVALGVFAAIHVSGAAAYALLSGAVPGRWLYLPANGQQVAAMLVIPFAEEPGWRGFALPRLQQRYGPLEASLRLGAVWALWHTMMFVLQGTSPLTFALSIANIVAGSVVFSWLYNHTRGSLLIAILAHAGAHLDNPAHALPGQVTPFAVYTLAMVVTALVLALARRVGPPSPQPARAATATLSP
jgi:membrane protease YdiL (CAAX protease family)